MFYVVSASMHLCHSQSSLHFSCHGTSCVSCRLLHTPVSSIRKTSTSRAITWVRDSDMDLRRTDLRMDHSVVWFMREQFVIGHPTEEAKPSRSAAWDTAGRFTSSSKMVPSAPRPKRLR